MAFLAPFAASLAAPIVGGLLSKIFGSAGGYPEKGSLTSSVYRKHLKLEQMREQLGQILRETGSVPEDKQKRFHELANEHNSQVLLLQKILNNRHEGQHHMKQLIDYEIRRLQAEFMHGGREKRGTQYPREHRQILEDSIKSLAVHYPKALEAEIGAIRSTDPNLVPWEGLEEEEIATPPVSPSLLQYHAPEEHPARGFSPVHEAVIHEQGRSANISGNTIEFLPLPPLKSAGYSSLKNVKNIKTPSEWWEMSMGGAKQNTGGFYDEQFAARARGKRFDDASEFFSMGIFPTVLLDKANSSGYVRPYAVCYCSHKPDDWSVLHVPQWKMLYGDWDDKSKTGFYMDMSMTGDADTKKSLISSINLCMPKRGSYVWIMPVDNDSLMSNIDILGAQAVSGMSRAQLAEMNNADTPDWHAFVQEYYAKAGSYFQLGGASLGLGAIAAFMNAPRCVYTGFVRRLVPDYITKRDTKYTDNRGADEMAAEYERNIVNKDPKWLRLQGKYNQSVLQDEDPLLSKRHTGIVRVSRGSDLVEEVDMLSYKCAWALTTEYPLVIPYLTNMGKPLGQILNSSKFKGEHYLLSLMPNAYSEVQLEEGIKYEDTMTPVLIACTVAEAYQLGTLAFETFWKHPIHESHIYKHLTQNNAYLKSDHRHYLAQKKPSGTADTIAPKKKRNMKSVYARHATRAEMLAPSAHGREFEREYENIRHLVERAPSARNRSRSRSSHRAPSVHRSRSRSSHRAPSPEPRAPSRSVSRSHVRPHTYSEATTVSPRRMTRRKAPSERRPSPIANRTRAQLETIFQRVHKNKRSAKAAGGWGDMLFKMAIGAISGILTHKLKRYFGIKSEYERLHDELDHIKSMMKNQNDMREIRVLQENADKLQRLLIEKDNLLKQQESQLAQNPEFQKVMQAEERGTGQMEKAMQSAGKFDASAIVPTKILKLYKSHRSVSESMGRLQHHHSRSAAPRHPHHRRHKRSRSKGTSIASFQGDLPFSARVVKGVMDGSNKPCANLWVWPSDTTVKYYERGTQAPDYAKLNKLAKHKYSSIGAMKKDARFRELLPASERPHMGHFVPHRLESTMTRKRSVVALHLQRNHKRRPVGFNMQRNIGRKFFDVQSLVEVPLPWHWQIVQN